MKKGFTLIEMAVVLLIIGILAGIVLRNIGGQAIQARDAKRVGDLRILSNYLAQYMAKQGEFPRNQDTSLNWPNLNSAFNSAGIFVNLPTPPTGAPYEYFPCTDSGTFGSSGVPANHFILRTQLEQIQTQAPKAYEGSYNSASIPTGWSCSATVNCSASSRYYCVIQ